MTEPTIGDVISAVLLGPEYAAALAARQPAIVRAARGDLDALRELADEAYQRIGTALVSDPLAYMEAIAFMRLAAAHGENADARALMFLLSQFAAFWSQNDNDKLATMFEAQALDLAERIAEEGDDEVGDMVVAAADVIPPAVHREAQRLRDAAAQV